MRNGLFGAFLGVTVAAVTNSLGAESPTSTTWRCSATSAFPCTTECICRPTFTFPCSKAARAERFPAVLVRTPYNKAAWGTGIVRFFAEHGYLSATQDCRGRFQSEGKFFPFVDDPKDGCDTIAWLARDTRCNGKVAMHGASYMAWVSSTQPRRIRPLWRP